MSSRVSPESSTKISFEFEKLTPDQLKEVQRQLNWEHNMRKPYTYWEHLMNHGVNCDYLDFVETVWHHNTLIVRVQGDNLRGWEHLPDTQVSLKVEHLDDSKLLLTTKWFPLEDGSVSFDEEEALGIICNYLYVDDGIDDIICFDNKQYETMGELKTAKYKRHQEEALNKYCDCDNCETFRELEFHW